MLAVGHLGMELHAAQRQALVDDGGRDAVVGDRYRPEAGRQALDRVAVAHPAQELRRHAVEQRVWRGDPDRTLAVLAVGQRRDRAAVVGRHALGPVTDAEHR